MFTNRGEMSLAILSDVSKERMGRDKIGAIGRNQGLLILGIVRSLEGLPSGSMTLTLQLLKKNRLGKDKFGGRLKDCMRGDGPGTGEPRTDLCSMSDGYYSYTPAMLYAS